MMAAKGSLSRASHCLLGIYHAAVAYIGLFYFILKRIAKTLVPNRKSVKCHHERDCVEDLNFLDRILEDTCKDLEPYILKQRGMTFNKKIDCINLNFKIHTNGYINGLRTLHTVKNCLLQKDGRVYMHSDVGAGVLSLHNICTIAFMNFGPSIVVDWNVMYAECHVEMSFDANNGGNVIINDLSVQLFYSKLYVAGLGPLNKICKWTYDLLYFAFEYFITKVTEHIVKKQLDDKLKNFQFPLDNAKYRLCVQSLECQNISSGVATPSKITFELLEKSTCKMEGSSDDVSDSEMNISKSPKYHLLSEDTNASTDEHDDSEVENVCLKHDANPMITESDCLLVESPETSDDEFKNEYNEVLNYANIPVTSIFLNTDDLSKTLECIEREAKKTKIIENFDKSKEQTSPYSSDLILKTENLPTSEGIYGNFSNVNTEISSISDCSGIQGVTQTVNQTLDSDENKIQSTDKGKRRFSGSETESILIKGSPENSTVKLISNSTQTNEEFSNASGVCVDSRSITIKTGSNAAYSHQSAATCFIIEAEQRTSDCLESSKVEQKASGRSKFLESESMHCMTECLNDIIASQSATECVAESEKNPADHFEFVEADPQQSPTERLESIETNPKRSPAKCVESVETDFMRGPAELAESIEMEPEQSPAERLESIDAKSEKRPVERFEAIKVNYEQIPVECSEFLEEEPEMNPAERLKSVEAEHVQSPAEHLESVYAETKKYPAEGLESIKAEQNPVEHMESVKEESVQSSTECMESVDAKPERRPAEPLESIKVDQEQSPEERLESIKVETDFEKRLTECLDSIEANPEQTPAECLESVENEFEPSTAEFLDTIEAGYNMTNRANTDMVGVGSIFQETSETEKTFGFSKSVELISDDSCAMGKYKQNISTCAVNNNISTCIKNTSGEFTQCKQIGEKDLDVPVYEKIDETTSDVALSKKAGPNLNMETIVASYKETEDVEPNISACETAIEHKTNFYPHKRSEAAKSDGASCKETDKSNQNIVYFAETENTGEVESLTTTYKDIEEAKQSVAHAEEGEDKPIVSCVSTTTVHQYITCVQKTNSNRDIKNENDKVEKLAPTREKMCQTAISDECEKTYEITTLSAICEETGETESVFAACVGLDEAETILTTCKETGEIDTFAAFTVSTEKSILNDMTLNKATRHRSRDKYSQDDADFKADNGREKTGSKGNEKKVEGGQQETGKRQSRYRKR